ncbi:hypothetical protein N0V94_003134 [Neodidymelliopsis sp. IMI 364377]|nr:hypothetical protein N0V94_003134 [Neodidymelliopsis sp. IMI 364377]
MRLILFATEGCAIEQPCSVGEALDWFLPFARNQDQSFCKAYARYDLGFSRTIPTLIFKPSQVHRIPDLLSNNENEASEYNDAMLYWRDIPGGQVMNDGCSIISVGAARAIWKQLKTTAGVNGLFPSAFQGRIGGAKGMWMISAESYTKDPRHLDIWIKISDSQSKFEPHEVDLSDHTCDDRRLTFEVSKWSSPPTPSELHIAFIPIMVDRGVPQNVIADLMIERLDADNDELLKKLSDPIRSYDYIHKNSALTGDGEDIQWRGALPSGLDQKIKFLLESGFRPTELQFLAKNILRFIKAQQLFQESSLRTPLDKSTYLYGVADPLGVLKPGEIHVKFSSSYTDEMTDERYTDLRGHDVLVTRQPACRRSDIQKVRAILHPDLAHLDDLVIFPSRGQYPLAGKLQGGDYDGDIFWLCWDDRLVKPFKNAPAPVETLNPGDYGVRVDKRKLSDIMDVDNIGNVDDFLRKSFAFRNNDSLLGIVTVFLRNLAYVENKIYSDTLDPICDLHDLLVDAPKQGYTFTRADFERYVQKRLLLSSRLGQPAYKKAMEDCKNTRETSDMDKIREKKYKHNRKNLIDFLYFEVLRARNVAAMKCFQELLSTANSADSDLLHPRRRLDAHKDPVVDEELRTAQEEISKIYQSWVSGRHKDNSDDDYVRLVDDCHSRFHDIKPQNTDHPLVKSWLEEYRVGGQCAWDSILASTLYYKLPLPTASTFVFTMAGYELARLKADRIPRTKSVVPSIGGILKPKPTKALVRAEDDEEKEDLASILGEDSV